MDDLVCAGSVIECVNVYNSIMCVIIVMNVESKLNVV